MTGPAALLTISVFLAVLAVVGLLLLAIGLRGRRIDNRPHCRRCGFDLTGLAPQAAGSAEPTRCPECGSNVAAPGAVTMGLRRRRPLPLLLGLGALTLALAAASWLAFGGGRLNTYKPVWMLRAELAGASPATSASARAELDRRIRKLGTLTSPQAESIASVVLAHQADPDREWDPNEGDLLEVAHANGLLKPGTWATYAKQAARFQVRGRSKAVQGEPWSVDIVSASARLGDGAGVGGGGGQLALAPVLIESTIDGTPVDIGIGPGRFSSQFNMSHGGTSWSTVRPRIDLPPGDYTLRTRWKLRVVPGYAARVPGVHSPEPLAEWEEARSTLLTVVPPGTALVVPVRDESLRAEMTKRVRADQCEIAPEPSTPQTVMLSGMLYFDTPPMDVAFDVFWRVTPPAGPDGALPQPIEIPVGIVTARKPATGQMTMGTGTSKSTPREPWMNTVATIDIILRPSIDAALKTTDIDRIWDGEIVIQDVKVQGPAEPAVHP